MDPLHDAARRPVAEDGRELFALLAEIERPEIQPLHRGIPGDLGQPDEERVAALDVLGAERRHDHDASLREVTGQEPQEVAGRGIAPVQILEHEDERSVAAQAIDQGERELEQPGLIGRATGRRRSGAGSDGIGGDTRCGGALVGWCQEAGETRGDRDELRPDLAEERGEGVGLQLSTECPERLEERAIRNAFAAQIHAATDEDPGPGLSGSGGKLVDQPRLAEPRVTADEDDRGRARLGPPQSSVECREFARTPDEDRAR